MTRFLLMMAVAGGLAFAGPSQAETREPVRAPVFGAVDAEMLDGLPIAYARHTREHRMWEINRRMQRQQARRAYRNGYGYGPPRAYRGQGYGYGRRGAIPYQGPDRGPPGYYGRGYPPRPYAGPGNGPPGYRW